MPEKYDEAYGRNFDDITLKLAKNKRTQFMCHVYMSYYFSMPISTKFLVLSVCHVLTHKLYKHTHTHTDTSNTPISYSNIVCERALCKPKGI